MSTITRGALRTQVRRKLADLNSATWTDTELNLYIQDGYDQFARLTKMLWRRRPIPDLAGEAVYDLPDGIIELDRVTWDDYRIESQPQEDSMYISLGIEPDAPTGRVSGYLVDGDGFGKIRKILTPSQDDPTKFVVEFFRIGAPLVSDTQTFDLEDHTLRGVKFFALAKARMRRGNGQNLDTAALYMQRYLEVVDRAKARNTQARRRHTIIVGGVGDEKVVHRPPRPSLPWTFGTVVRPRR